MTAYTLHHKREPQISHHRQSETKESQEQSHRLQIVEAPVTLRFGKLAGGHHGVPNYQQHAYENQHSTPYHERPHRGGGIAEIDGARVVGYPGPDFICGHGVGEHLVHAVYGRYNAGIIVTFTEMRNGIVADYASAYDIGQNALQTVAGAHHHAPVVLQQQDEQPVVAVFLTHAPVGEKLRGEPVGVIAVIYGIKRHDNRFGSGSLPYPGKLCVERGLGLRRQHAVGVGDIAGRIGHMHVRHIGRSICAGGDRSRTQHKGYYDKYLFHFII